MQFGTFLLVLYMTGLSCFNRYCVPMDSPRPLLSMELEFFTKGTGKGKFNHLFFLTYMTFIVVPLVVIFTKYDAQIIQESVQLNNLENYRDRWAKARENADITFQRIYLTKVLSTEHPPKAHVRLEGEENKHFR